MTRRLIGLACVLLALTAAPVAAQDGPSARPLGRWEHKLTKGGGVTLVVEENRLHLTLKGETRLVLHADYSMTRDGVLYGVVTSAEAPDGPDTDEQDLLDEPFSIVCRLDEGVLVVRDVRSGTLTKEEVSMMLGRYEKNSPAPNAEALLNRVSRRGRDRGPSATPTLVPQMAPSYADQMGIRPLPPPMVKEPPTQSFYPH